MPAQDRSVAGRSAVPGGPALLRQLRRLPALCVCPWAISQRVLRAASCDYHSPAADLSGRAAQLVGDRGVAVFDGELAAADLGSEPHRLGDPLLLPHRRGAIGSNQRQRSPGGRQGRAIRRRNPRQPSARGGLHDQGEGQERDGQRRVQHLGNSHHACGDPSRVGGDPRPAGLGGQHQTGEGQENSGSGLPGALQRPRHGSQPQAGSRPQARQHRDSGGHRLSGQLHQFRLGTDIGWCQDCRVHSQAERGQPPTRVKRVS